jgi:hypothetical protein
MGNCERSNVQAISDAVVCGSADDVTGSEPAEAQLPFWSGQYTAMASLMNCAAYALFMPVDSSSV